MGSVNLLIFSKSPDSKEAKTRLWSKGIFKQEIISKLHRAFLADILELCTQYSPNKLFVAWFPDFSTKPTQELIGRFKITENFKQNGSSFSERFNNSVSKVYALEQIPLIVLGTDCPYLSIEILEEANEALQNGCLVIGPAQRNGFYLVAFPACINIPDLSDCFGSDNEIELLVKKFPDTKIHYLEELNDIDYPEDLNLLLKCYSEDKRILKHTRDALVSFNSTITV